MDPDNLVVMDTDLYWECGSGNTQNRVVSPRTGLPVGDRRVRCKGGDLRPLAERVQVLDLTPPTQQRFQQGHQL
jgi:hypothetical protein